MDHIEHKKKFQLERIILFSDAVFAIAITLLVIELRLPELEEISNKSLLHALIHVIPHFFSFVMSFMIIGLYWVAHHQMFYYIINYDRKLLWLNLFVLFFIALMPFSSSIYGVYSYLDMAFYLYVSNITMIALFNYLLYGYISRKDKNLSHGLENPRLVHFYQLRSWSVPAAFMVGVIVTLFLDNYWGLAISRTSPILIIPAMKILSRKYSDAINADKSKIRHTQVNEENI